MDRLGLSEGERGEKLMRGPGLQSWMGGGAMG